MKKILIIILCMIFLTSCSGLQNINNIDNDTTLAHGSNLKIVTNINGGLNEPWASSKQGFYEIMFSPHLGDSMMGNILYTDYETKRRVYLCDDVSCNHSDETCTSYTSDTFGGAYLISHPDINKLLYVQSGNYTPEQGEKSLGRIWTMDFNGANKTELYSLDSNEHIAQASAADSQNLYVVVVTVENAQTNPRYEVRSINIETGATNKITEIDYYDRLYGAFDEYLVFQNVNLETQIITYRTFSLKTQEEQEIYSYNFAESEHTSTVRNSKIYDMVQEEANVITLYAIDLITSNKKEIAKLPYDLEDTTLLDDVYGKNIVIDIVLTESNGAINTIKCIVNEENGSVSDMNMEYEFNGYLRGYEILGEYNDYYLIRNDIVEGNVNVPNLEGVSEAIDVMVPVNSMILKQDYYNNNPVYHTIEDTVVNYY